MRYTTPAFVIAALLMAAPLAAQTRIGAGETVTGTLEEGDRRMEDGAFYDSYVIRGRPGELLVVRMTSNDFDTYLHWGYEDGGQWVDEDANDDSGEGTNSRLAVRIPQDGGFELRAAAFDQGEEGEYELRVMALTEPSASRIGIGQTVEGRLDESDYEGAYGVEDHYLITGEPGTLLTIFLRSDEIDTYVEFGRWTDGGLEVTGSDDDGGGDTNSELVTRFGQDGEHRVVVRAFSGEELGGYTLRVEAGDVSDNADYEGDESNGEWVDAEDADSVYVEADTVGFATDFAAAAIEVRLDELMEASLGAGGNRLEDGAWYQDFVYSASAGEVLTISAASDDIDAYVQVGTGRGGGFTVLGEDDDGGSGTDAELEFRVPESGEYVIRVTSALGAETGLFVLLVRPR